MKLKILAVILLVVLGVIGFRIYSQNRGFSPWMNNREWKVYMEALDVKDAEGKAIWGRGYWVEALQARWRNGRIEKRLRVGKMPPNTGIWWYWYLDCDREFFDARMGELCLKDRFTLVSYSEIEWPDGTKRYYGVWHKYMVEHPSLFDYFAADGRLIRYPRK